MRVLLADDHADVTSGLRMLLETQPGTLVVGQATSGKDAVEKARALQPDVVVMDFSMRDMDGVEAAGSIRAENPETQVVILSVYEAEEHAARAREAGVRRWIPKSRPPDALLGELRMLAGELRQPQ